MLAAGIVAGRQTGWPRRGSSANTPPHPLAFRQADGPFAEPAGRVPLVAKAKLVRAQSDVSTPVRIELP